MTFGEKRTEHANEAITVLRTQLAKMKANWDEVLQAKEIEVVGAQHANQVTLVALLLRVGSI